MMTTEACRLAPTPIVPNFERIPSELRRLKNWVVWRYFPPKRSGGKWRKVPFQPSGKPASSMDPSTWNSFADCCSAYERGGFSGVGFVFDGKPDADGHVYAGVDFDSEALSGENSIETAEWVDRFGSYVETSVSGTGIHLILKAKPLASGIAHNGIELYTSGRFFTVTGLTPGEPRPIVAAPDDFSALAQHLRANAAGGGNGKVGAAPLELPDWVFKGPPKGFADLPVTSLSAGLEANIEELRSAASVIPAAAIASEPEWMKIARAFAYQAAICPGQADDLWGVLDELSRKAPGYDRADNRQRFERYIKEALHRTDPITIGTIFHTASEHGWQGWSPPLIPPASLPVWSAASLGVSFSNIPHRRWLYGTYLIRGEITILAAPGGAGKTALATGIAVEIGTGTGILDERIYQAHELKVLFINGEDGGMEIQRRICAFHLAHSQKLAGKILDRLYVAGADHPQVQRLSFLLANDRAAAMIDERGFQVLESAIETIRPDLLVLDPLIAFCGGADVNDNALMAQVIRELKRLAARFDTAVLIVHHTRKGVNDGNAEAIMGASSTVNLARRALMPVPMSDEEAVQFRVLPSDRFRYFKLMDAKSNLAPRSADSPWYRLHSIELPNPEPPVYPFGDNVQAVQRVNLIALAAAPPTTDERKIRDAIVDLVTRGKVIDGKPYPYSPTLAGAKNDRSILDDAMEVARNATAPREWLLVDLVSVVKGEIEKMKNEGFLAVKDIKDLTPKPGRFRRGRGLTVIQMPQSVRTAQSGDVKSDVTALDGASGELREP